MSPDWETICCMEMFVDTLKPFSTLTDAMSMEKSVSICSLYPLLLHIKDQCDAEISADINAELKAISKSIRASIWSYINDRLVFVKYWSIYF